MLFQYLRSAFRSLLLAQAYSFRAVLCLALGIGGNLAIFTGVNAVVLKPLAFPNSDQLILVTQNSLRFGKGFVTSLGIIPVQFLRWLAGLHSLQSIAAAHIGTCNLLGDGVPEKFGVLNVSSDFFDTLRVRPHLGRWFSQAAAAALPCFLIARSASTIDPLDALRAE